VVQNPEVDVCVELAVATPELLAEVEVVAVHVEALVVEVLLLEVDEFPDHTILYTHMSDYSDETDRMITRHLARISLKKPSFKKLAAETGLDPGSNPEATVRTKVLEGELMAGNTNTKGLKEQLQDNST
jgi:hypothetical protein